MRKFTVIDLGLEQRRNLGSYDKSFLGEIYQAWQSQLLSEGVKRAALLLILTRRPVPPEGEIRRKLVVLALRERIQVTRKSLEEYKFGRIFNTLHFICRDKARFSSHVVMRAMPDLFTLYALANWDNKPIQNFFLEHFQNQRKEK